MKKQGLLRNESGFTLVEIIAVLILLGILAAVAVPKYIDLQDQARTNAAQAAVAELKGRASSVYGKYLLENNGTAPSVAQILAHSDWSVDVGSDYVATAAANGDPATGITITVTTVQGEALTTPVTETWTLPTS